MKRRDAIKGGLGTLLSTGIAGCGILSGSDVQDSDGDGVIDSEDYAPQDPNVQEKSDVSGSDSSQSSSPKTNTGSNSDSELIGTAVGKYKAGYQGMQSSKDLLGTAIDSYGQENYGLVEMSLEGFESDMNEFSEAFGEAASAANELGEAEVQQSAIAGQNEIEHLVSAADSIRGAAKDAKNENWNDSDAKLAQAQTAIKSADKRHKEMMKPSDVESKIMEI
ncbi:hypothetical protein [Haloarcula sp. CBA1122]|uniref:hypothetical protein n=1 Tax=Haloarcula sp. CBA1122 TaxID=2668069 RepID=UPI0018D2100C|nr:hypothetical protein [Haloarcula sp. CBA1122]